MHRERHGPHSVRDGGECVGRNSGFFKQRFRQASAHYCVRQVLDCAAKHGPEHLLLQTSHLNCRHFKADQRENLGGDARSKPQAEERQDPYELINQPRKPSPEALAVGWVQHGAVAPNLQQHSIQSGNRSHLRSGTPNAARPLFFWLPPRSLSMDLRQWSKLSNLLLWVFVILNYLSVIYKYFDPEKAVDVFTIQNEAAQVLIATPTTFDTIFKWFSLSVGAIVVIAFVVLVVLLRNSDAVNLVSSIDAPVQFKPVVSGLQAGGNRAHP